MTETQNQFVEIRNAIYKAFAEARRESQWNLELLLTLDHAQTHALKMMWTS
jgi:hypothetical protein